MDPRSMLCPQSDRAPGRARTQAAQGGRELEKGRTGAGSGTRALAVVRRRRLGLEPHVENVEMDLDEPEIVVEPVLGFGAH